MIDLHAHVLSGLDDGARDMEESVRLVNAAAEDGTTVIAATPHLRSDFPDVRVEELATRCRQVNEQLPTAAGIRVVPGGEVSLLWAQEATPEQLRLASFRQRGDDVLVETPYGALSSSFEQMLFRVSLQGFRVLLAHPERNPSFQEDPRRLSALVERGILLQLTASSLASANKRSRTRRLAHALVEEGVAHVIASDAHSADVVVRSPLSAGVEAAAGISPIRARWMAEQAPAAILEGEPLPDVPAEAPRRRRWRFSPAARSD